MKRCCTFWAVWLPAPPNATYFHGLLEVVYTLFTLGQRKQPMKICGTFWAGGGVVPKTWPRTSPQPDFFDDLQAAPGPERDAKSAARADSPHIAPCAQAAPRDMRSPTRANLYPGIVKFPFFCVTVSTL